jgi:pyruvate/2-oxoglutarate dehydrogenase complex dihydrolipoamide dehydrogenase (E3) component
LVAEATAAGVKLSANALVWSVFGEGTLGVSVDGRPSLVRPVVTVVATGSTDVPLPFAGGSLPGVFSARAVLIAVNEWRVRPGRRWAIVGGGPERDEVAEAVGLAGGEVVVTADAAAGDEVVAEGASGVEAVAINGRRFGVDCVAVAAGRQPDAALAVMAGCALGPDPIGGGLVPVVDAYGRSSDPRIVVAGDAAGVCDPEVALAEGRLAGLAAAAVAGRIPEDRLPDALERERVVLAARLAERAARAATYVQPYR